MTFVSFILLLWTLKYIKMKKKLQCPQWDTSFLPAGTIFQPANLANLQLFWLLIKSHHLMRGWLWETAIKRVKSNFRSSYSLLSQRILFIICLSFSLKPSPGSLKALTNNAVSMFDNVRLIECRCTDDSSPHEIRWGHYHECNSWGLS